MVFKQSLGKEFAKWEGWGGSLNKCISNGLRMEIHPEFRVCGQACLRDFCRKWLKKMARRPELAL